MATRSKTKTQARQASADKRPKAIAKYVRISPRKVKLVIDQIRGKNVDEAAAILTYTPKAASPVVLKVLNSAIANAVNNQELDRKELYVAEVYANPGPTLKRYVARSRGSASPMLKRTSHITVVLDQKKGGLSMGQKVNPHGARVGVIFGWSTRWYADKKDFANNLVEDFKLRKMIKEKYYAAGISRIDIERTAKDVTVNIMTSKPGMIIGPKGATIEQLKAEVTKQLGRPAQINVMEIKQPDADAQLVAENIAQQLEKRISFRRALKQAQQRAMKLPGVKGIKTSVSGRLGGADIARTEHYHDGSIPLQTLRANIDYGFAEAKTTYGRLGVKVWIYKGQILPKAKKAPVAKEVK